MASGSSPIVPDGSRSPGTRHAVARAVRTTRRASMDFHPLRAVVRLVGGTASICLRYRVTGLAAEAAFFALLSLPPLVLGLAATAAWFGARLGVASDAAFEEALRELVSPFLTEQVVEAALLPTLDNALSTPRLDLISLGFVLSLWSGSRALNVYVDTISIMYGLGGHRGILRTRALSFALYLLTLLFGAVTIPLVLVGPELLRAWLAPQLGGLLLLLYWPVVTVMGVALLTTLYHIATPVRTPWRHDLPGAVVALVIWVAASFVLRVVLGASIGGQSIYGPLAAPIVVLIWLYLVALAVLIGAALNATVERWWPHERRAAARAALAPPDAEHPLTPVQDREGKTG